MRESSFPEAKIMPCGNMAYNEQALCGYPAYRCRTCMAVYGSIGCPCNEKSVDDSLLTEQIDES